MRHMCVIVTCLVLTSCQEQEAPAEAEGPDTCGSTEFSHLMGATRAQVDATPISRPLRVLNDGDAMTMDYRAERLNFTLNKAERVVRIWCG